MPEFPKPQGIRSQCIIDEIRNAAYTCQIPTCPCRPQEVHHSRSKGSGGPDIRCNLIAMCSVTPQRCAGVPNTPSGHLPRHRVARGDDPGPSLLCCRPGFSGHGELENGRSGVCTLQQDEEESGWKKAGHAAFMLGKYGRGVQVN